MPRSTPCPPTAAQQAKGDTCTLTFGDEANDSAVGTITLRVHGPGVHDAADDRTGDCHHQASHHHPHDRGTGDRGLGGATPTTVAPTAPAPTGPLATTGPGRGVGVLGAVGALLLLLGLILLLVMFEIATLWRASSIGATARRCASPFSTPPSCLRRGPMRRARPRGRADCTVPDVGWETG